MSGYSKACCTKPVSVASDENIARSFNTIGGVKSYVTGPRDAKTAVLINYDIFGFTNTLSLKAADLFGNAGYLTVVPDLLNGEHPDVRWLAEGTAEGLAKFEGFAKERIDFSETAEGLPSLLDSIQKDIPGVKAWGAVGCTFV